MQLPRNRLETTVKEPKIFIYPEKNEAQYLDMQNKKICFSR